MSEEEAPPGYMWINVRSYENGKPVTKKELVPLEKELVGAPTKMRDATDDIKKMVSEVKPKVEALTNQKYTTFEALKYTSQVVAGTNYKVKVKVGDNKCLHLEIFKPLPCNGTELRAKVVPGVFKLADSL